MIRYLQKRRRSRGGDGGPGPRIVREQATIASMMQLFCQDHHGNADGLCAECESLLDYARKRLQNCPFAEEKPACNLCEVHCYSAAKRDRVKAVMRYAGPRMLWHHPIQSLRHLLDKRRPVPKLAGLKRR